MLRSLPVRYRIIFVLSVVAALLSIPTMGMVIADFVYQMSWRSDETGALDRIEAVCRAALEG